MGRRDSRLLGLAALLAPLALLGLLAAGLACGGGGGGGGSPSEPPTTTPTPTPTPTPSGPRITFTPQGTPGTNGIALAQGAGSTATSLVLEVQAEQVNDLYGVAFDLTFPTAALHFQSVAAGPFLGGAGQVSVQAVEGSPGTLVVGVTRLGSLAGVSGSGVLAQLVFTPVASGQGSIAFARNSGFDGNGAPLTLTWRGGNVQVVQ